MVSSSGEHAEQEELVKPPASFKSPVLWLWYVGIVGQESHMNMAKCILI